MLVAGREFSGDIIERIRVRVRGDSTVTRTGLSPEICGWLDWRGAHGRLKEMSCRVALLKLERGGVLELPPARRVSFARAPGFDAVKGSFDASSAVRLRSSLQSIHDVDSHAF